MRRRQRTIAITGIPYLHAGMQRAGHLLAVVFTNTPRKAHFWSSVDNVNVKQQNLTIFVCLQGSSFYLLVFENLVQSNLKGKN